MFPEQALGQAARQAGLRLLVLFGSRVPGHVHGQSDWDFGYLAGKTLDEELLRERLMGSSRQTLSIWLTYPRPVPC